MQFGCYKGASEDEGTPGERGIGTLSWEPNLPQPEAKDPCVSHVFFSGSHCMWGTWPPEHFSLPLGVLGLAEIVHGSPDAVFALLMMSSALK